MRTPVTSRHALSKILWHRRINFRHQLGSRTRFLSANRGVLNPDRNPIPKHPRKEYPPTIGKQLNANAMDKRRSQLVDGDCTPRQGNTRRFVATRATAHAELEAWKRVCPHEWHYSSLLEFRNMKWHAAMRPLDTWKGAQVAKGVENSQPTVSGQDGSFLETWVDKMWRLALFCQCYSYSRVAFRNLGQPTLP